MSHLEFSNRSQVRSSSLACDDHVTMSRLIDQFFLPYLEIRNRREGYAVSILYYDAVIHSGRSRVDLVTARLSIPNTGGANEKTVE